MFLPLFIWWHQTCIIPQLWTLQEDMLPFTKIIEQAHELSLYFRLTTNVKAKIKNIALFVPRQQISVISFRTEVTLTLKNL